MPYKITVKPLAKNETLEAYDWYESQLEGLGIDFLTELEEFYDRLSVNPEIYSFYEEPIRQGILSRFRYTIVFEPINDEVIVYSVFMNRQDPSKKRSR